MDYRVPLVALLLVVSGCAAGPGSGGSPAPGTEGTTETVTSQPTDSPTPTSSSTSTATPTERATATSTPAPTPTPTATPRPTPEDAVNPWGYSPIVVAIDDDASGIRRWAAMVEDALEFWNTEGKEHTGYDYRFVLDDEVEDPDLVIQFRDSITQCGDEQNEAIIGCAPELGYHQVEEETPTVEIEAGYTDESTTETIIHEIGHALGMEHEDADELPVMSAHSYVNETDEPAAAAREWPYRTTNFTVYVGNGSTVSEEWANEAVDEAVTYYEEDDEDWLPRNVSFERVENRSAADFRINITESTGCEGQDGVCWEQSGFSPDDDPELEYYSGADINVVGVPATHYEWYVGYALGRSLGAETEAELPPTFRDPDNADDRWFDG